VCVTYGRPWPAGDSRPRSRRGSRSSRYSRSVRPSGQDSLATATITVRWTMRGGADGSGRAPGLTLGGNSAQLRAFLSRGDHGQIQNEATLSRASRSERRPEPAAAGASGGASGPCRPGLKTYRKSSSPECGICLIRFPANSEAPFRLLRVRGEPQIRRWSDCAGDGPG
jgi:hypothetical protein